MAGAKIPFDRLPLNDQLKQIEEAHLKCALLTQMDSVYTPIFERLERELVAIKGRIAAVERARLVVVEDARTRNQPVDRSVIK